MAAVSELKFNNVIYKGGESENERNREAEWRTEVLWETYSNKKEVLE